MSLEENRPRWGGWTSNPVRVARRLFVGSTPTLFRQSSSDNIQRHPETPVKSAVFRKISSGEVWDAPLEVTPKWG